MGGGPRVDSPAGAGRLRNGGGAGAAPCRALQAREDAAFWQRHAAVQRAARLSGYIF